MKVIDFLEKANSTLFSYEIIPPFRGGSIDKVFDLVEQLMPFDPPFIDLTSRSAESYYSNKSDLTSKRIRRKRPGTIGISAAIKNKYNVETVPHILCNGFSKEETEDALIELNYLGIDNVLAVRGDDLRKDDHNLNSKPGNKYASDLVHQIKNMNNGNYLEDLVESTPSDFCIGVGGYPEKHFESADMLTDIKYLKKKID
ncbi:MAG: methylenetetrahydrofolate reductase, partial [Candidatus Neomarinimicrobiota bacterium]|nr:methylenetetrahydrofolate reductase [Candidatus Neomarinimicrobiota bacterium]